MEINLKETLRTLRQQKNVTQEMLASHLGITAQSVGKWERGEGFPDITLLPKIALYFNVSIDDLLNVGQARIDEKIEEYKQEAFQLGKIGDNAGEIALWEKAHQEFPNNHYVMKRLMGAIANKGQWPIPKDDAERVKELALRILEESTDTKLRESAIFELCFVYKSAGDVEKALYYADLGGNIYECRQILRASVLTGEEGIKESQNCLLQLIFLASQEAINIINKGLSAEEEIRAVQFSIDLMKLLFSDGNFGGYGFEMSGRYMFLARAHAMLQNTEKTMEALEECVKYCVLDAQKTVGFYTAPMVNRLEYGKYFSKNYKGNACNARLEEFELNFFDFIRDTPLFQELKETLKEYAE